MSMQAKEIVSGDKRVFHITGNWEEYLDEASQDAAPCWEESRRQSRTGSKKFTGTKDFEEAMNLARYGWPQGRKFFAEIAQNAVDRFNSIRPGLGYDVGGMYPVVPRFVGGDPACMVTNDPIFSRDRHIIPVYVSFSASNQNTQETINNRGGAIAGLIDTIEDAGHSVELIGLEAAAGGDITCWTEVLIKDAGEPLDLDRMAFALTHPSMLRRIHFAITEAHGAAFESDLHGQFVFGYGVPVKGWPKYIPGHENHSRGLFFDALHGDQNKRFNTLDKAVAEAMAEWDAALERIDKGREAA